MSYPCLTKAPVFPFTNEEIADPLEQVADLLETQDANPYRVRAYRQAAQTLRVLDYSAVELLQTEGKAGLEKLPGIGKSLSASLEELIHAGRLRLLERLQGEVSPEDLFTTIPGIGEELAHRLHLELGLETLEELELAAHEGRLEQLKGFGLRRTRLVRNELATMLSRSARQRARLIHGQAAYGSASLPLSPTVDLILEVDAQYRQLAAAGKLRTITPRRFNPDRKRWLPILHLEQDGWSFTALYSNTARAHELGRTHDWVVIYYEREGHEAQCTVVTEIRGSLKDRRVVRGREADCASAYA
ncbi:MAG: helix-hairpin-helix domain-containing protein [Thermosynechococcaceae cyanobacterium]